MRSVLALAAAGMIPACGGSHFTLSHFALPVPTSGTILYVGPGNVLVNVSPAQPNVILSAIGLKNLQPAENILAIDYHPTTGELFALGNSPRLYRINPRTGDCSPVGPLVVGAIGTDFGMDVNPGMNEIRVVGAAGENFRLDPFGGPETGDPNLAYAALDPNFGTNPNVVACAYDNNAAPTLYGIDSSLDILVLQSPANNGTLNTVSGGLGVDASNAAGFDITAANLAYAALEVSGFTSLYTINLTTGAAGLQGVLGSVGAIRGFTLVP